MTAAGLVLDIVGVLLLSWASSMKHIEQEWSYNFMKGTTDDIKKRRQAGELVELNYFDSEEHKRRLSNTERCVRENHCRMQSGLFLIVVGFLLQLLDTLR